MAIVIVLLTVVVVPRTPTDIFPEINIPVIATVWTYNGLQPQEMEQRITTNVERGITVLVNDVEHIESQSLNGIAIVKIFFHPGANIQTALAQTTAISQTFLRTLPPGTTPPLVIIYSASTVPVLQIGLTSDRLSEQQLFDYGNNFIRTQLATVQGASMPFPYGGKQRLISVDVDFPALQARGLAPVDIVNAVNAQNLILPTGTAKLGTLEYNVELNGSPRVLAVAMDRRRVAELLEIERPHRLKHLRQERRGGVVVKINAVHIPILIPRTYPLLESLKHPGGAVGC